MKRILFLLITVSVTFAVYAQSVELDNTTDVDNVAVDTGRLLLREISISTLDDPTLWTAHIPFDKGAVVVQRFLGSPLEKNPLQIDQQINDYNPLDEYVLGVRSTFFSRAFITIDIKANDAIFMPGVVKVVSFWVSGRSKEHQLSIVIRDMNAGIKEFPAGDLNFTGWRKIEVPIPLDINQKDVVNSLHGLYFLGFKIRTNFEDNVGRYYLYLDDIRVVSDVIDEVINNSGKDDIADGW